MLLEPSGVGGLGRVLVAADPTGAPSGLWEARGFIGCDAVDEPGAMGWQDLQTTDPAAARTFHGGLSGYRSEPMPGASRDDETLALPVGAGGDGDGDGDDDGIIDGGGPIAGIGAPEGDLDGQATSRLVSFGVVDTAAAVTAVSTGGGTVLGAPLDTPSGVMATVADPFGAVLLCLAGSAAGA